MCRGGRWTSLRAFLPFHRRLPKGASRNPRTGSSRCQELRLRLPARRITVNLPGGHQEGRSRFRSPHGHRHPRRDRIVPKEQISPLFYFRCALLDGQVKRSGNTADCRGSNEMQDIGGLCFQGQFKGAAVVKGIEILPLNPFRLVQIPE